MFEVIFIGSPLLLFIAVGSYHHWKAVNSEDYPRTFLGYLVYNLDHFMAAAGGVALAFLLSAFEVEDKYIATAVLAMIKGCICVLIGAGILVMLLRAQKGFGRKAIVYGCVLALVSLSVVQHEHEKQRAAEASKRPMPVSR